MTTALITGASSGIGRQFAISLARMLYDLVLVARREDRLKEVADLARGQGASKVEIIAADLSKHETPAEIHRRLEEAGIQIDYLVNNAGFGTSGRFDRLPLERELEEIDLNVGTTVALARLFLPGMVERRRGVIINVASSAGFQPTPFMATYGATKAFVVSFSESLASELAGTGVHVTALCPGPVRTEFQDVAGIHRARVPFFFWYDVEPVVQQAIAAATAGRSLCIPGALNFMMVELERFTPRSIVSMISAGIFRPTAQT